MKLPCNVILLMALLSVSQTYKHLSWRFQHIPRGSLNFAWYPSPSAKPIDEPASVVTSSDVYMSAWLLKYSNHVYIYLESFSIYFWSLTCNRIVALQPLSFVFCCHCRSLGGRHWGISCQCPLKLRISLVIQQHNWDDETMLIICNHFEDIKWGDIHLPSTWMTSKNELERSNFILPTEAWGHGRLVAPCIQKDEFRVWRMRRHL